MKKYVASFEISEQVTEDSWRLKRYSLEIDGTKTLSEIENWIRSKGFKGLTDIQLSELEQLETANK
jgi:hypothetical protein